LGDPLGVFGKRGGAWWIKGVPDYGDAGPYSTKAEAESDRRGMERFFKYENRKGFVTTEPKK